MEHVVVELHLLGRVLLAAVLSAAIGLERGMHGRPAGLRTHLLVGSGAALVVVTFLGLIEGLPSESARIAAGVITGIGFLGAGTILRVGDWVRGLTTAASLWFVAGLGIVAGTGLFVLAVGGALTGLAALTVIGRLEHRVRTTIYQTLRVEVTASELDAVRAWLTERCAQGRVRLQPTHWRSSGGGEKIVLTYLVRHRGSLDLARVAEDLSRVKGVRSVRAQI